MGMDVFGRNPTAKEGEYFRNNVWYWRPLADLCIHFAPDICSACEHWHSNDGDGLDATGAQALAKALDDKRKDGGLARYIAKRDEYLLNLPDVACTLCNRSGARTDDIGKEIGLDKRVITEKGHPREGQTGWCNACEGTGFVRPFETYYPCELNNVVPIR